MSIKSADDLIVQTENQKLGIVAPEQPKEQNPLKPDKQSEDKAEKQPNQEEKPALDQDASESPPKAEEDKQVHQEKPQKEDASDDSGSDEVDDYGNKVEKPKLYTEEQVQKMIRDRLARGKASQSSEQSQQVQDAVKDFQADPESSEGWEQQLESFIEKTITKVSQKSHQEEWQKKEREQQDQFEDKFTRGISRYSDFGDVVGGKPVTNGMMLATRSMPDPAAFLYAACKQHPAEIERISQIPNAVEQAAEIGRLEERMKKAKVLTKAPAPAKKITGDMSDDMPKRSVDQLIADHAKTKIMHRR